MAVFGEFLTRAGEHIAAVVSVPSELPDGARCGVIRELDRLVPTLARYLTDVAPPDKLDADSVDRLNPEMRAAVEARIALRRAAHSLRQGAAAIEDRDTDCSHPAVRHLSAAADHLAAGRDLLQTHFTEGPFGGYEGNSYWAPVITSGPATSTLLSDLAGYARQLAPWAARLSVTGTMDSGVPAVASLALHAATRWLWVAGAAVEAAQRQRPLSTDGQRLLAAVPVNTPPPRLPPMAEEPVPELCERTILTADRLRHAAWAFARQARWSPTATSQSWRRDAYLSAITGHSTELVLRTLDRRAGQTGTEPGICAQLRAAAETVHQAWNTRRALTGEWDIISTGTHRTKSVSPVTAELGDLVLHAGRLAFQNPQWTPAASTGIPRDPADLAPAHDDVRRVFAAVHHAVDAMARVVVEDMEAVRTAAADNRLYLPTRLMPADCDIPYRYTPAPRSRTDELLAAYDTVITADVRAVAAMDHLAESLDAPSELLAAARTVSRRPAPARGSHDARPRRPATMLAAQDQHTHGAGPAGWHGREPFEAGTATRADASAAPARRAGPATTSRRP